MKGEIVPFSLWNPYKHRGFQGIDEGWRVFAWFFFQKYWFRQNAYLWHNCALQGAHLCSLRSKLHRKESDMSNSLGSISYSERRKSGNHKRCLHHHFFQHYSTKKLPKSFFIRIFAQQTKETKRWKQRISTNWSQKTWAT